MKLTVRIEQDTDAMSPSEWEDTGLFIVANHRDFYVPEPGQKRITDDADTLADKYVKPIGFLGSKPISIPG